MAFDITWHSRGVPTVAVALTMNDFPEGNLISAGDEISTNAGVLDSKGVASPNGRTDKSLARAADAGLIKLGDTMSTFGLLLTVRR